MDEAGTDHAASPAPPPVDGDDPATGHAGEGEALRAARARSSAADDVPSPAVGALLAWVARSVAARSAVEIGSAAGVTGLWLLGGLTPKGVLTSVEPDAHRHGLATQAYAEAGVADRVRAIEGDPVEVLPRLADGAYDVVLLQDAVDPTRFDHALRLVRSGGIIAVRAVDESAPRAVVRGLVGDPEPTILERITTEPTLDDLVLPLDDTIVLARRRPDAA